MGIEQGWQGMEEIDIDCQWLYKLEKHTIRLISVNNTLTIDIIVSQSSKLKLKLLVAITSVPFLLQQY